METVKSASAMNSASASSAGTSASKQIRNLATSTPERLRELKAKRDEGARTLTKLRPMHSVPPYLYKLETIQRVQA